MVVHGQVLDKGWVRPPRADRAQVLAHGLHGLLHPVIRVAEEVLDVRHGLPPCVLDCDSLFGRVGNQGPQGLARKEAQEASGDEKVKDDDRQMVVHAQ